MTPNPEAQLRIMDRLLAETKAECDRLREERNAERRNVVAAQLAARRLRAALEDHLSGRIGHVRLREALDPTEAQPVIPGTTIGAQDTLYTNDLRGTTP